jgi:lipopolysaccharide export system permease protein
MKIIDRHLRVAILHQFLLVLAVLMALFVFITFIDELSSVNRGNYGLLKITQFVLLSIPKILYEVFPIAALIGAILGLSNLAKDSELTVMRSVGVSINRIVFSTVKVGILLGILAMILGEVIAPFSETKALRIRAEAIQSQVKQKSDFGLWMRDESSFISIGEVLPDLSLINVKIFEFDQDSKLRHLSRAKNGIYDREQGRWVLENLDRTIIDPDRAFADQMKVAKWDTKVNPEILGVFLIKPEQLSIWQLLRYINHLKVNNQETKIYRLSFWNKIIAPFTTLVMLMLAVPFVFRQVRSGGLGKSLFSGIMMGLGFFILTKAFGYFVLLYNIPAFLGALIPTILVLGVSMLLVKRVT